jgi:hypothetical protein
MGLGAPWGPVPSGGLLASADRAARPGIVRFVWAVKHKAPLEGSPHMQQWCVHGFPLTSRTWNSDVVLVCAGRFAYLSSKCFFAPLALR